MHHYMLQLKRRMRLPNSFENLIYILWSYKIIRFIFLIPALFFQLAGYFRSLCMIKKELPVLTIVIGNIHVGGSGKTPFVKHLAHQLTARGYKIGIICKAYKVKTSGNPIVAYGAYQASQLGDEAALLGKALGCPVASGKDRYQTAQALLKIHNVDILIFDDGLQYPGINYGLKIVLYNPSKNLNGGILPSGPLRAPLSTIIGSDMIINTNLSAQALIRKNSSILTHGLTEEKRSICSFKQVYLAAGVADASPIKFFLQENGIDVKEFNIPDHGICSFSYLKQATDLQPIIVTRKDWVKLQEFAEINLLKYVWIIELELELDALLEKRLLMMIDQKYQLISKKN
jgi:tetraacyldisaccharide 4'-kinase